MSRTKNAFLPLLCLAVASGCTSLRPVQLSRDDARHLIGSGQLLKPGDKVTLGTEDGKVHQFAITSIDTANGVVNGAADSVRIADIVTVAKREPAIGKTIGLVLGIITGLQLGNAIGDITTPGL